MCDHSLKFLECPSIHIRCICDNVDHRNTFQALHFLKVDKAAFIPVDFIDAENVICSIRVALQDAAILASYFRLYGHMEEDRIGRTIQHCVGGLVKDWEVWWPGRMCKGLSINGGLGLQIFVIFTRLRSYDDEFGHGSKVDNICKLDGL